RAWSMLSRSGTWAAEPPRSSPAATLIMWDSLGNILPRRWSIAALWRLIWAHFECPAMCNAPPAQAYPPILAQRRARLRGDGAGRAPDPGASQRDRPARPHRYRPSDRALSHPLPGRVDPGGQHHVEGGHRQQYAPWAEPPGPDREIVQAVEERGRG